jgi:hypothetical protein
LAFSPDGRRLVTGCQDYTLRLWDTETGQLIKSLRGPYPIITSVALSSDGRHVAGSFYDATVRLWETETWRETYTFPRRGGAVYKVLFSPDSRLLANIGFDQTVRLWDVATGREVQTLGGQGDVGPVTFRPDGKQLATAGQDNTIRLHDLTTGQRVLTLAGHIAGISDLAFSPDGQRLASASRDKTVKLWDVATGQETLTLKSHTHGVLGVGFSRDGHRLFSGSEDGTLKIWDATRCLQSGGHALRVADGTTSFKGATPMDTLLQVRECARASLRTLNGQVDRDLETICLTCLVKEPQNRYSSAEALAEDLERWLAGEPIQARPASQAERLWRWSRRNPLVACLSAVVLLVTLGGLLGVLWQWQVALANEQKANGHAAQAQEKATGGPARTRRSSAST